jgi:hypothetical protein
MLLFMIILTSTTRVVRELDPWKSQKNYYFLFFYYWWASYNGSIWHKFPIWTRLSSFPDVAIWSCWHKRFMSSLDSSSWTNTVWIRRRCEFWWVYIRLITLEAFVSRRLNFKKCAWLVDPWSRILTSIELRDLLFFGRHASRCI